MADYKKMYTKLFNKITDVIEELQEVQKLTEQMYIDSSEPEFVLLSPESGATDPDSEKQSDKGDN